MITCQYYSQRICKMEFSRLYIINYYSIFIVMSRSKNNRQLQPANRRVQNIMDHFDNMQKQMMRNFGGFGIDDDFFGSSLKAFQRDPFEDMFKFSDLHQNMHNKKNEGTFVCQSFVSSSKVGPDGKVYTQKYYENNLGQHKNGNTISEKQQAYKNNLGVNRIAQERMLNDMGRKIIKQKKGRDIEQTNHYYNIEQQEARNFDERWNRVNHEQRFLEDHGKYLGYNGMGQKMLRNQYPRQYQQRRIQPEYQQPRKQKLQPQILRSNYDQPQIRSNIPPQRPIQARENARGNSQVNRNNNNQNINRPNNGVFANSRKMTPQSG